MSPGHGERYSLLLQGARPQRCPGHGTPGPQGRASAEPPQEERVGLGHLACFLSWTWQPRDPVAAGKEVSEGSPSRGRRGDCSGHQLQDSLLGDSVLCVGERVTDAFLRENRDLREAGLGSLPALLDLDSSRTRRSPGPTEECGLACDWQGRDVLLTVVPTREDREDPQLGALPLATPTS